MFIIAVYDDRNEIEFLPQKWLVSTVDIASVIRNRTQVQSYWPPWRNLKRLGMARRQCIDADIGWPKDTCRILATAG